MSSFLNRSLAVEASEWLISSASVLDTDVVFVSWAGNSSRTFKDLEEVRD